MARRTRPGPYWLIAVEEICEDCNQPYAYAVEARCAGCDRPLCMICTVSVEGEVSCKECSRGPEKRRR